MAYTRKLSTKKKKKKGWQSILENFCHKNISLFGITNQTNEGTISKRTSKFFRLMNENSDSYWKIWLESMTK